DLRGARCAENCSPGFSQDRLGAGVIVCCHLWGILLGRRQKRLLFRFVSERASINTGDGKAVFGGSLESIVKTAWTWIGLGARFVWDIQRIQQTIQGRTGNWVQRIYRGRGARRR